MKYWGYLVAKLVVAGALWYGFCRAILFMLPKAVPFTTVKETNQVVYVPTMTEAFTMMLFGFVGVGLLWLVVWDQKKRCRTCLRRLRMPILTGSWTHVLFGRPRTEYICPYGHGTLKIEELQLTGHQEAEWEPHGDIWKELK